jgi:peptidyl-prolyl cis-trans isomerase C
MTRSICILSRFFVALVVISLISIPQRSMAFWPFSSGEKMDYLALVGGVEVISTEDFLAQMGSLHKSGRVGKALSEETSFAKESFQKFLQELIDNKLMVIEARSLGLEDDPGFKDAISTFSLNLSLERLRKDEIFDKVVVTDKEIEDYYWEEIRKKEEARAKKEEKEGKEEAKPEAPALPEAEAKAEDKKEAALEEPKEEKKEVPQADRDAIRRGFVNEKARAAEKAYFEGLRKGASVKIDEEALKAISTGAPESRDIVVASGDLGEIKGEAVLAQMGGKASTDIEANTQALEKLILFKLLDREALSRGYENDPAIARAIAKQRDKLLIDGFKKKVILPTIKVEEKDVLEYYEANKERYKTSDRVDLAVVHVNEEDRAKRIFEELTGGGDFAFIARTESVDPSKERGGDAGWVDLERISEPFRSALRSAKKGELVGPVAMNNGTYIIALIKDYEAGGYIPPEAVGRSINIAIGKERYSKAYEQYLEHLRKTVEVKINKRELKRIEGD